MNKIASALETKIYLSTKDTREETFLNSSIFVKEITYKQPVTDPILESNIRTRNSIKHMLFPKLLNYEKTIIVNINNDDIPIGANIRIYTSDILKIAEDISNIKDLSCLSKKNYISNRVNELLFSSFILIDIIYETLKDFEYTHDDFEIVGTKIKNFKVDYNEETCKFFIIDVDNGEQLTSEHELIRLYLYPNISPYGMRGTIKNKFMDDKSVKTFKKQFEDGLLSSADK